jgi:hypothetical protein
MNNPYKRMYVITEDEYMQYKRLRDGDSSTEAAAAVVDGKVFAHGFACNICRQVFKTGAALHEHLTHHAPQVPPSNHSIFDNDAPTELTTTSINNNKPPPAKKHKLYKSVLNFEVDSWLTLK